MRVLLVHNRYRTPGGEERHIDLLEEELGTHHLRIKRYEVTSPTQLNLARRVAVGSCLAYRPSSRFAIRELLRSWRPDIVHAHNLMPLLTTSVLHEAQKHGRPGRPHRA